MSDQEEFSLHPNRVSIYSIDSVGSDCSNLDSVSTSPSIIGKNDMPESDIDQDN